MKTLTLLALCFFGIFNHLNAQEDKQLILGKTNFGIKGGGNLGYIDGINDGISFYGGLFAETRLSKTWSLQNELIFSVNNYPFLEIPIFLKYHIGGRFSIFGGPKLDILLADSQIRNGASVLGLSAEIGVEYQLSKSIFFEARYSHGITNQIPNFNADRSLSRTSNLRFGIGYKF